MQAELETVRLARGAHSDPQDGICVMELASMLAGEAFSDRPRCVDPVIGAYLRTFNDRIGHAERQRLVPYAQRCVGTRGSRRLTSARRDLCLHYAGVRVLARNPAARALALLGARARVAALVGLRPALRLATGAGELAGRAIAAERDTEAGLGLLDALLHEGATPASRPGPPAQGAAAADRPLAAAAT